MPGEEPTGANFIFLGHRNFSNGQACCHSSSFFRMGEGHGSAVGTAIAAGGVRDGFESVKLGTSASLLPSPGSLAGSVP